MQEGNGEQFVDELLMPDGKGEKMLFANLYQENELREVLERNNFEISSFNFKENTDPDEVSQERKFLIFATNKKGNN